MKTCPLWFCPVVLVLILLPMQGCVAKYKAMAEAAQSELSPRTIAQDDLQKIHVHEALVADHGISGLTLSVYVFMAKVFVVGHVDTHEQVESVLKTARQVAGVRSADGYLPLKDGQASDATAGGLTSDATMKAHIISTLAVTPGIVNSRVHVEVLDGHVVLLGVVSGQEEQLKAGRAAAVEGVKDVTNWLLLPESRYMSIRRKVL